MCIIVGLLSIDFGVCFDCLVLLFNTLSYSSDFSSLSSRASKLAPGYLDCEEWRGQPYEASLALVDYRIRFDDGNFTRFRSSDF